MNVLMITGDKHFEATPRFALQAAQVERLTVVFWGRGSLWPGIHERPYDVISVQDPFWRGLFALSVARRLRAKLNVQVHTDLAAESLVRRALARLVLRRADSVRVVSEKGKRQVTLMGVGVPIHVLPIFVDVEKFRHIVPKPHEHKTILWIGRFENEKDPMEAIVILKDIRAQGIEAHLIMLGAGSLEETVHRAARGLPVEFPGWQDPSFYLARADVVLSTSRHESWGASIVEALAAGVPVVAPDVGIAGEAGAIVVPREKLARAVMQALADGKRGFLKLVPLDADAWAKRWRQTLL